MLNTNTGQPGAYSRSGSQADIYFVRRDRDQADRRGIALKRRCIDIAIISALVVIRMNLERLVIKPTAHIAFGAAGAVILALGWLAYSASLRAQNLRGG